MSFDRSSVTLASCAAASVPKIRHTNANIRFVDLINLTFRLLDAIRSCHRALAGTSQLRIVPNKFLFGAQPIFELVAFLPAT
jgi:hypothetical protein